MSRKCEITGKKTVAGKSRYHRRGKAGGVSGPWSRKAQATNRTFRPNLTKVRVLVNGVPTRMTVSMKALKQLKRDGVVDGVELRSK